MKENINKDQKEDKTLVIKKIKNYEFDISKLESDFDFDFSNSLRSWCVKDRLSEIYNCASENLDVIMDIETLIKKYNEIDMVKNFIFDSKQSRIFETIARFKTVITFFSSLNKNQENVFQEYDNTKIDEIFHFI